MNEDRITALEKENSDLRLMLAAATEHGDTVEALLHQEVQERKQAQAVLESILRAVQRSKADLEIILETMVDHGEAVTQYELCNQAVELMRQREEQFTAIATVIPLAILVSQPTTQVISYANHQAMQLLGEHLIGKAVPELFAQEYDRQYLSRQLAETGTLTNYELQMHGADGLAFWAVASVHSLSLEGRTVILHTFFEINDRKRTESCLQQSEAILRERVQFLEVIVEARTLELQTAEAKYRSIFENAVAGIYQITPAGRFVVVNPALARIYKYDAPADLIRTVQHIGSQLYVNANRYQQFMQLLASQRAVNQFESQVYCKDGSIIWISENAHAVKDGDGKILYYEGIVQDITARRLAEAELRREQANSEWLLLNILPQTIAYRRKQKPKALIAESYPDVSILVADIVDFTEITSPIAPQAVVALLNKLFSCFDALAECYGLEKIRTNADEYMVVGGLPDPHPHHTQAIAHMALAMQKQVSQFTTPTGWHLGLRIGIGSGSAIAGVIGQKKFTYDLWGDAVNLSKWMKSNSEPHKIQVSEMTYVQLRDQFEFQPSGVINIPAKGSIPTYWLLDRNR